jgi:hypothetical protein
MSKDFFEARSECIEALGKLKSDLEYHKEALRVFKKAFAELDKDVAPEVGDLLHEMITREIANVNRLEAEIRGTNRILNERYSLAPAN